MCYVTLRSTTVVSRVADNMIVSQEHSEATDLLGKMSMFGAASVHPFNV
jgi:hypothetical protein